MWKPLVVLAIVANTVLITPSEGTNPGPYSGSISDGNPHRKCREPNQVYDLCPAPCPPRECGVDKTLILCAPAPKPGSRDCKPGCRCADGFVKNEAGVCIPKAKCPKDCPKNETLDPCVSDCPPRLCGVNIAAVSCLAINESNCEPGCRCSDGFLRNAEGFCVLESDCPKCTNENEVYDVCPAPCPPKRCDVDERVYDCAPPPEPGDPECEPGCRCADGFVRNYDGICVTRDQCPKCTGANEVYDVCPAPCPPRRCDVDERVIRCAAPPEPGDPECEPGCRCADGFVRNADGVCVTRDQCPLVCGDDEVYSECIQGECRLKNCSQVGFSIPCPRIDPRYCIKGCLCKVGYARAASGTCIPKEKCPSCGGDPNAVSGCGINCGRHCSDYNKGLVTCQAKCNPNGCDCKKRFVLDDSTGKCIRPRQCVSCHGDYNAKPGCDKDCSKRCPGPKPTECKCLYGCMCKDGFVFDPKPNKCVRPEQCSPPCGNNEVLSNCSNGGCGPWTCEDVGFPTGCVKMDQKYCKVGCVCKTGFVKENDVCIPVTDCPECGGDPNATAGCGINCGRLCANYNKEPVACIAECRNNACDCRKKFVFDDNTKKCVLPKDCTPVCGQDEIFSDCVNGGCDARNCSQLGKPVPCVKLDPKYCIKGCVCKEGYLRASNGICVPVKKCDNCNQPHEHYDPCAQSCPPQTCESIGRKYRCPITAAVCRGACKCDKGYFRNKIGECITKHECLRCRGPHEYFSCGSACDNVCATLYKQNQTNCPIINIKCNPMCYCEQGYARDKNHICIPIDKCPKPTCGENERLEQCPPGLCTPQKCTELGFPISCPDLPKYGCPKPPGCVCIDNHVRDARGKCIPSINCPSCGGDPNAITGCGNPCTNTCKYYNRTDIACLAVCYFNKCDCRKGFILDDNTGKCVRLKDCTPVCKENEVYDSCANGGCGKWNCSQLGQPDLCIDVTKCIGGCICQKGFLRANNGTCIPQNQCPIPPCGKNEVFEFCPDSMCEPKTCSQLGRPIQCPALSDEVDCLGEPACICDYNFVRNDQGVCIPKKQCPSCGGDPNAESGCGLHCGNLCSDYNKGPRPCPRICKFNSCDCKKGFVFDVNTKKCVSPNQCTPICGKDEVYSECINGGCQAKNCSQLGRPVPCVKIDPKYCIKGCLCKEGYLREKNGVCVPKEECERNCCEPHTVYDPCPPTCPPQTCESIGKKYGCPAVILDDKRCKGACRCQKGYFRNKIGECISKEDCLKCTGPNEYFSCGGACDNVCATLYEQNQTNCPIINIKCNPMCYCAKEYARDKNNICIPIDQCPVPKCPKNERLENCPDSLCSPQSCSQLGFPIACASFDINGTGSCPGRPGCVCIDDYVRDDCGKCIPKNECPSCGGDPNAMSGCGSNCGKRCSDYKKKNVICPLFCLLNGCDCRPGFVYDSNIRKCVCPEHCTPVCGYNEVYDTCANGGCQKRNCSQVAELILCIDPIKCIGGCVCQEGFLRNKDGICVPRDECPQQCTKPHEVYDPCSVSCPPQTCESIGVAYPCPHPPEGEEFCRGACRCEHGYYRNTIGECISERNCLKCTGPNEYFSCRGACDNVCATLSKQNQTNCPIINKKCNPMCYCNEGYARDDNNTCIPIEQCEEPVCRKNEVFDTCANGGCNRRKCSELTGPIICRHPIECIGDCVCVKGFLRNEDGVCVPEKKCQPKCNGRHQVFDFCPSTCPPRTCESLDMAYICPIEWGQEPPCEPGCVCEEGYFSNKIGDCISQEDCLKCRGPHEFFSCGGACDNVCATLNEQNQTNCPIVNIQCNSMCYCEDGYARDENDICIPIDECPPTRCGPDERYEESPARVCEPLYCSEVGVPMDCPPVQDPECDDTPGCICKQGLVRNDAYVCIPISECLVLASILRYFESSWDMRRFKGI